MTSAERALWQAIQRHVGAAADGIPGAETAQKILQAFNISPAAPATPASFWDSIEYFTPEETACPCCGRNDMQYAVVASADNIRKHFGKPATVSSGYRCARHNAELPGAVSNSKHLTGEAIDMSIAGVNPESALEYARSLPAVKYAYSIMQNGKPTGYIHINT